MAVMVVMVVVEVVVMVRCSLVVARAGRVEPQTRPVLTRYRWSIQTVCPCVKDYPSPGLTKTSPNSTGN